MLLRGKLTDLLAFGICYGNGYGYNSNGYGNGYNSNGYGNGYGYSYGHSSKVNNGLEIITTQTLKEE